MENEYERNKRLFSAIAKKDKHGKITNPEEVNILVDMINQNHKSNHTASFCSKLAVILSLAILVIVISSGIGGLI